MLEITAKLQETKLQVEQDGMIGVKFVRGGSGYISPKSGLCLFNIRHGGVVVRSWKGDRVLIVQLGVGLYNMVKFIFIGILEPRINSRNTQCDDPRCLRMGRHPNFVVYQKSILLHIERIKIKDH